jgi:hypothetical protein
MKYSKKRTVRKKRTTRKNKGGFLNYKVAPLEQCSSAVLISQMKALNNSEMSDEEFNRVKNEMENTYKECCPKKFGLKNTSAFCKQLQQNHKTATQAGKMYQTYRNADLSPEDMFNMEQIYDLGNKKDIAKMQSTGGKKSKKRISKTRMYKRK